MAPLTDMLSDDITWHSAGTSPASGDYAGKDEVFGFFAEMMELYGGACSSMSGTFLPTTITGWS